ncbi:MAG: DUF6531 domain-containing protein [Chloroflexi bacterium]|nr:DUF6531 domain-containing protein [Chloroflexota bacterium]MCI0578720.1 DUF6531 domain-containing protein [Chloroflexota bacterium]MCI0644369.1 DUF6531 domain-containing protein [Chloroflexota bacterium]MCI0729231.1 DUF6531 domain-containing protein [Chloroflexota bacterium]
MNNWRLRQALYRLLAIVVCLSLVAQASPLMAMSYEPATRRQAAPRAGLPAPPAASSAVAPPAVPAPRPTPAPQITPVSPAVSPLPGLAPGQKQQAKPLAGQPPPGFPLGEITLIPDWNLVSLPTRPPDTDPAAVLAPIAGDYNVVFAYDGCNPADPWQVYDPAAPPVTNNLAAIDHKIGLWLQATTATTLPLAGSVPPTTTIELCTGWNLIGMPTEQPRPVRNALFSIEGQYSLVFGYNPADAADPWEIYDVSAPGWANDLQVMQPGRGYWVLATENTTLTFANVGEPPAVEITSPEETTITLTSITFITDVVGTASSTILQSWTLAYRPQGEEAWTAFATGTTPVVDGVLGQFDPTLLRNGLYEIELTATDYEGRSSAVAVRVLVDNELKLGTFSLTFIDLEIPAAGIPIQVRRTYDSRDRGNQGDFGHGWTLSLSDVSLQETKVPGEAWEGINSGGPFPSYCIFPTQAHNVTITLPDDTVYSFRAKVTPECQPLVPQQVAIVSYEPLPGTFGALMPLDAATRVNVIGSFPGSIQLWEEGFNGLYDPNLYQLTTQVGVVLVVSQEEGLQSVTDPSGNTLTFDDNGITHSNGVGITFQRDDQNRITQITDPLANVLAYSYDGNGDLALVTDQADKTTAYTYTADHYLTDIIDARGVTFVRNEYDENGRLVRFIDGEGNATTFSYSVTSGASQQIITDRLGNPTIQEFDGQGNLVREIDALGHETTYTYDAAGNQLTKTDPLGHTETRAFDERGNVLSVTDPLGNTTAWTYGDRNQVLTQTDANGNTTTFEYSAQGNPLTATDALSHTTTFAYDAQGNLAAITDSAGNTQTMVYNARGDLIQYTDSAGNEMTFTYDANGNELTSTMTRTDANGDLVTMVTQRTYDELNRTLSEEDPLGNVFSLEYNDIGALAALVDKTNSRIEYEYDLRGNRTRTIYPDGSQEIVTYNAEGNILSLIDRAGRTTTYEYDPLNRPTRAIYADGSSTQIEYDAAGRKTAEIDENSHRTTFAYDAAGRQIRVVDALGNVTRFGYDAVGNQITVTNALSQTTTFVYDARYRLIQTNYPDGSNSGLVYDSPGNVIEEIDQAGLSTFYEYDALGRVTRILDALDGETSYSYDEVGNLLSQTDANGHITRWTYNDLGQQISRILSSGLTETFTYDGNGNLLSHTDFNGVTITYDYDSMGRVITKTVPGGQVITYDHTLLGQLSAVSNGSSTVTYTYDLRDRLTGIAYPDGAAISYGYDAAGNRTSLTTPSGTTLYTYDALHRLATVTDAAGGITTYTYDPVGNQIGLTQANGASVIQTFDLLNRITRVEHRHPDMSLLASYDYTLDAVGNRLQEVDHNGRIVDYTYDDLYRLVEEEITDSALGNALIEYTYDAAGNRLSQTENGNLTSYTYDVNDRLLQAGDTIYSYDNNGNTLGALGITTTVTFEYDAENRMTLVTNDQGTASFAYDAGGVRVQVTENGVVTDYLIDPNQSYEQVIEERDGTGNLLVRYEYGNDLLSQAQGGNSTYYHYDALGSTRLLSDDSGSIANAYTYAAYGRLLNATGTTANNYLFTGEQYDAFTGLYYLRTRYYQPDLGRFLTMDGFAGDPFTPQSLHKYGYAHNNPVNFTDPSGQFVAAISLAVTALVNGVVRSGQYINYTAIFLMLLRQALIIAGAAVGACVAVAALTTFIALPGGLCSVTLLPTFVPGYDMPFITAHNINAISSHRPWGGLNRIYPKHSRTWIHSVPPCNQNKGLARITLLSCDEYPFASTAQGGQKSVPTPSLALVPLPEQWIQGGRLEAFYAMCKITPNVPIKNHFAVAPNPFVISQHRC